MKTFRSVSLPALLALLIASSLLSGCTARFGDAPPSTTQTSLHGLRGTVHGGQQPLVNAAIYLYAASTAGYGAESVLLTKETVLTEADGSFDITGTYSCTAGQEVYINAVGGESSGRPNDYNSGASLLAILGTCPDGGDFLDAIPYIAINEVSTVAAAYAFAPFATDWQHVGSPNTPAALTGIHKAFANAALFYDISGNSGQGALTHVPTETTGSVGVYGYVPSATINTLANLLAYCVNSVDTDSSEDSSSIPCTQLFYTAPTLDNTETGAVASDTAQAALNIAHYPGSEVLDLYDYVNSTGPFQPTLPNPPNDFALYVFYTNDNGFFPYNNLAIDSDGQAWFVDSTADPADTANLTAIDTLQGIAFFSTVTGNGAFATPTDIAIDPDNTIWVNNYLTGLVSYSTVSDSITSPTGGYTCTEPLYGELVSGGNTVAVDSSGNIWQSLGYNFICKFSSSGSQQAENGEPSPYDSNGYPAIAADAHGAMWEIASAINTEPGSYLQQLTSSDTNGPIQVPFSDETNYLGHLALDHAGNIWVTNPAGPSIIGFNPAGESTDPFTNENLTAPVGIAIDGLGHIWATNGLGSNDGTNDWPGGSLFEFAQDGTVLSAGYLGGAVIDANVGVLGGMNNPRGIAIDGAGDIWVGDPGDHNYEQQTSGVYEFIGIAAPVVTPLAAAAAANTIGTRP